MTMAFGFGGGQWGGSPWGVGAPFLRLIDAQPRRENVVRLTFNVAVRFTGILDPHDASSRDRYDVQPIADTFGADENPTRDVDPIIAELVAEAGAGGAQIDLVVDRPFSPYPSRYLVSVNNMLTALGMPLEIGFTSLAFDGLRRGLRTLEPGKLVPRRDIANPNSLEALLDSGSATAVPPELQGSFVVDGSGDYAVDAGIVSYKKRVFRRLLASRGRFAHLPGYGVGALAAVKQLGRGATKQQIASDAETQIRLEPETEDVQVTVLDDPAHPELLHLQIHAKLVTGDRTTLSVPVPVGLGT